jgi:hypothetical protein
LLSNEIRIEIIKSLVKKKKIEVIINFENLNLSPGNFLIFNEICINSKIDIDKDYLFNIQVLLGLYKKNKDISLINMILFLTDYFFYNLKTKNNQKIEIILENKSFVTDNIKKFITYNLNQTSLINAISRKLGYE